MTKNRSAGRITRADQAWGPAHREYIENDRAARIDAVHGNLRKLVDADHAAAIGGALTVAPQRATLVDVIPATQSLSVPLKFVQAALLTSGKDDIRYYLNGVYIHAIGREVRICGTDGHRLAVSRYVPDKEETIPQWAEAGIILPREELSQALPILSKIPKFGCGEPSVIIDHKPGAPTVTLRSVLDFATFKVKPVDGKFPDYDRVVASAGASLVRGEGDAMVTTSLNAQYLKGAAEIAAKLGAKSISSFLGDGQAAAVFTFEGAPDTMLIIMPMRSAGDQVPDGVVRMLGSAGVSGSLGALRAHLTRTTKALTSAKDERERETLEARKSGFEQRIAHLMQITTEGPKQLEHREAA